MSPDALLRALAVSEYGHWPNGGNYCPDCGRWIDCGDGKLTDDNFEVHRWCK